MTIVSELLKGRHTVVFREQANHYAISPSSVYHYEEKRSWPSNMSNRIDENDYLHLPGFSPLRLHGGKIYHKFKSVWARLCVVERIQGSRFKLKGVVHGRVKEEIVKLSTLDMLKWKSFLSQ